MGSATVVNIVVPGDYLDPSNSFFGAASFRKFVGRIGGESAPIAYPLRIQRLVTFHHLRVILADKADEWIEKGGKKFTDEQGEEFGFLKYSDLEENFAEYFEETYGNKLYGDSATAIVGGT